MNTQVLSPIKLVVRCFAECKDSQWQAFSLEFGLAAQADSFTEVRAKLDAMIQDYLYDALVGEDREHARELLTRRATLPVYLRYFYGSLCESLSKSANRSSGKRLKIFDEPWSMSPERCVT
jgi:hypothetical protein